MYFQLIYARHRVSNAGMKIDSTPRPVPGFLFGSGCAGIKPSGADDLGVIVAASPARLAAVFTQNCVVAAPVLLSRRNAQAGTVCAVVVNSGNANACTGKTGDATAQAMADTAAAALDAESGQIQVASTGVIGVPLDVQPILQALPAVIEGAGTAAGDVEGFAAAIRTTDQFSKGASTIVDGYSITVIAKGAGMIAPNMATLLVYAVTDAPLGDTQSLWQRVIDGSFNAIIVDGDTSTNDTALLLSSDSGPLDEEGAKRVEAALLACCRATAQQVVADGEGARCVVTLTVSGAATNEDADRAARAVATSPLCKTAFHGADPNWGRIVAAAGRSGARLNPTTTTLTVTGESGSVRLYEAGVPTDFDTKIAEQIMATDRFSFQLNLGAGSGEATVWTCDLGHNYVTLNAEYTT
jgi:glutamate N-acetyltransferase / amino-acid N-acetyltransferase